MWYWLMRLQGLLLIPPFIAYYALKGLPFFMRCRKCRRWLLEQQYLLSGICDNCMRDMALSDTYYTYVKSDEFPEWKIEMMLYPTKTGAYDATYRRVVKRVGYGKVLDVGCGQGYILSGVQSERSYLYGIDIQKPPIKAAQNWIEEGNFCLGDIRSMPYKSNTFDYLICTAVLEHIKGDDTIRECYRVLKPGGVAIFTVPNGRGIAGKINPTHIRLLTFEAWENILTQVGFKVISGQKFGLYIPFISPFLQLLLRTSGRRLPLKSYFDIEVPEFLADEFLIECGKPKTEQFCRGIGYNKDG